MEWKSHLLSPRKTGTFDCQRTIFLALPAVVSTGLLLSLIPLKTVDAQQVPPRPRLATIAGPIEEGGVYLPSNRTLVRGITTARQRIAQGEYTQAIRFLNDVLVQEEDSFEATSPTTDRTSKVQNESLQYAGLKETARRIIRDLPAEGRAAYELAYQAHAQRLLVAAIQSGSIDELSRIGRQYFYTPAGYEATLLYAQNETDHGRHLAAALAYGQLLDTPRAAERLQPQLSILAAQSWLAAGDRQRTLETLAQLKHWLSKQPNRGNLQPSQTVIITGQPYPLIGPGALFDRTLTDDSAKNDPSRNKAANTIERLRQLVGDPDMNQRLLERDWLTLHGNEARNGQTEGGLPHLHVRWKVRLLGHPKLASLYDDLMSEMAKSNKPAAVAASPLAIGNTIITRSANQLIAVDFRTGKLVWAAGTAKIQPWEQLLRSAAMAPEGQAEISDPSQSFAQRIWQDRLLGVISSDGKRVFAIDNLSSPPIDQTRQFRLRGGMGRALGTGVDFPESTNSLSAYDLKTEGRLLWEVNGQTIGGEMQGSFFLGAPLAIGQALYSLVEIKSAIYLVALNSQSGQPLWRQKLVNLESGILMSPQRRLQASSPSYDAGILVCPTGAGVVIGVDLAKRSLAWAYRYDNQLQSQLAYRWQPSDTDMENSRSGEHWVDHSPILANGRVLLSPPESKFLHCLELATGKILWKFNRKHYHTLACVTTALNQGPLETTKLQGTDFSKKTDDREVLNNRVAETSLLLLGNSQATSLRLRDGKPNWQQPVLRFPAGVQPSGTGFQSHGRYYLPLTSAEVIAIDLAQGTIINRTKSRDGQILGNLICHQGTVLSQNGRSLDRYDQVEMLEQRAKEQLATNQSHAEALRVLGEIAYDRQQLDQAIDLLIRAHQSAPEDLVTREDLTECLLSALDEDFASYRDHLDLLTQLIDSRSSDLLQLQRIHAAGLLSVGEPVASLDVCLQIFQNAFDPTEMLSIGGTRQVQVARWVQAQTHAIWTAADNQERGLIHQRMTSVLASLKIDSQSSASLDSTTDFSSATSQSLLASRKLSRETARSEVLHRYLQFFGDLPQSRPWWLQRARALLEDGQLLAAQQILLSLSAETPNLRETQLSETHKLQNHYEQEEKGEGQGNSPWMEDALRIEHESTALLAQILHLAGLHRLAREWDQQLSGPLADVVCFPSEQYGDMTGAQCVSHWRALQETSAADSQIFSTADWPYGKVDITTTTTETKRRQVRSPLWGVRLERADPTLASSTILMSSRKGEVVVRNDLGLEFFRANLQLDGQQTIHYRAPGITYSASHGNLLVVSLGTQLVAFNTLVSSDETQDKVLWRSHLHRTINPNDVQRNYGSERSTSKSARLGSYRAPRLSLNGKWMGVIGPVTSKGCVYQDQRHLICCDPNSGQILWSRTDVPTGCDLFGDDQYVIASPPSGNIAYVFRMTDGRRVSQGTIPRWKQRLATLGHQIIRWREVTKTANDSRPAGSTPTERRMELSCIDALSGDIAWAHTFQNKSRLDIARNRFVAVVEPSGKCSIIDARTGQILVHDTLFADPKLSEIHLLVATDRFTLLTSHPQPQNNTNRLRGLIPDDCPMISGQVACYDRSTGKPCWNRPADITQQALLLTQPCNLPILLFVNFSQRRDNRGSRPVLSMLILEKASGRTLYRNNNLPNTGGSHLLASVAPAKKQTSPEVKIEMTAKVIHLKFTDAPRSPLPPAMAEVESGSPTGSQGIFGIIKKLGAGS